MTKPTLRQKLDTIIQERLQDSQSDGTAQVTLTLSELQSLAEMLREDEPPDTTGTLPGSYAVTKSRWWDDGSKPKIVHGFSVTGPGIHGVHNVPVFTHEHEAEGMCRCLWRAFYAGARDRAKRIRALLEDQ